jgi:hypothetical protein
MVKVLPVPALASMRRLPCRGKSSGARDAGAVVSVWVLMRRLRRRRGACPWRRWPGRGAQQGFGEAGELAAGGHGREIGPGPLQVGAAVTLAGV